MSRYKLFTFFALLFTLHVGTLVSVNAQEEDEVLNFSLKEAQDYAVKRNLNVQISRLDIDAAKGQVKEVKSIGLPQVNGSVGYNYNLKLPASLVPGAAFGMPEQEFVSLVFGTKQNLTLGLEATQLLFDGSYLLGLKAARMFVDRSEEQAKSSEISMRNSVAESYFAALVTQENIDLLNKNIEVLNQVLFETSELYKNGFVEQLEVDRLKLSVSNLETQLNASGRNSDLAYKALKFQLGLDLNQEIKLTDELESYVADAANGISADVNGIVEQALKQRSEMKLLAIQNVFRDLDIRQIKAQYLPNLVAFLSGQTAFQSNKFNVFDRDQWIPSAMVGLRVNVPIFDGFEKRGKLEQRYVTQRQAFKQEELTSKGIELEVSTAQIRYVSAYEQYLNQKENLILAEKIYDVTLIKYKEGLGSSLEVSSAESSLYETQGLYIGALYELVQAKISLDVAMGNFE